MIPHPQNRTPEYPVDPQFVKRWSPRAMTGAEMPLDELMTLFEAARWAPSSGNGQPWRFLFARRNTPAWETFFNLLTPGNQIWAHKASALVLVVSRTTNEHNGKPAVTHSFDAGAAWMSLALQASLKGLVAHGMGGYDRGRATQELKLPEAFVPEAMLAIGYYGNPEDLPEEKRAGDANPSQRKPLAEIVFEGEWPES
jgi:nitroreductase